MIGGGSQAGSTLRGGWWVEHRQPGWQGQDESKALCVEMRAASWVTCQALMQSLSSGWKVWGLLVPHPGPNCFKGKEDFLQVVSAFSNC